MQLAAFERYSADCSARTPADAALHRHLTGLAGAARAMFEQTLVRVVAEEGIAVAGWLASAAPAYGPPGSPHSADACLPPPYSAPHRSRNE